MLAKQVWGGGGHDQSGSWVAFSCGPNLLGPHLSILELHAALLSLQSSFVPVGFLALVFSNLFNLFSSSPEAGLVSIPVSYVGSEQYLLPVSRKDLLISPHEFRGFSASLLTPLCLGMFLSPESGRSVQQIERFSMLSSLFGSGPDGYPYNSVLGAFVVLSSSPLHQN